MPFWESVVYLFCSVVSLTNTCIRFVFKISMNVSIEMLISAPRMPCVSTLSVDINVVAKLVSLGMDSTALVRSGATLRSLAIW